MTSIGSWETSELACPGGLFYSHVLYIIHLRAPLTREPTEACVELLLDSPTVLHALTIPGRDMSSSFAR